MMIISVETCYRDSVLMILRMQMYRTLVLEGATDAQMSQSDTPPTNVLKVEKFMLL